VVGAVVVDVLVTDLLARPDDERRPELGDPPPGLVDPVPGGAGPLGPLPAAPVREQPEEPDAANRRRPGGTFSSATNAAAWRTLPVPTATTSPPRLRISS
jgi:hypothetical protein